MKLHELFGVWQVDSRSPATLVGPRENESGS